MTEQQPEAPASFITEAELAAAFHELAVRTGNGNAYFPDLARNIFGFVQRERAAVAAPAPPAVRTPAPAPRNPGASIVEPAGAGYGGASPAPVADSREHAGIVAEPHADLLETAWGVIANAGWNDDGKTTGWQEAAERWRDDYHRWLDLHLSPGGYQTWEELAVGVTRERDALFSEVEGLRRALRDMPDAMPVVSAEQERAEAAEARLAAITAYCQGRAHFAPMAATILAITGTEEENRGN